MVLKDFECPKCGYFSEAVSMDAQSTSCACGQTSRRVFLQAPALTGEIRTHFNAHYDEQLGQHFNSPEEKKAFLKKTNRDQISGNLSPRKSNKTSILCTKDQAKKLEKGSSKPLSGSTNEPL